MEDEADIKGKKDEEACGATTTKNGGENDSPADPPGNSPAAVIKRPPVAESDGSGSSSDISSTLEREAPDGGWGWVVVGAGFFINLIADGVTFSFGVFLASIQLEFGSSKSTTSWVGSLLASMPLLSGPIASTLTDRFGCRKMTIVGSLLATIGFCLSYFASNIHLLMLTFGIITGFGLSLCYVSAVVIVAYYFDRRRSLATGLSVCGGGIGTFIFNSLNSKLIGWIMWRPTLLFCAGCFFSLAICGLLMKDLEWTKKSSRKREKVLQNEHDFNTQALLNFTAVSLQDGGKSSSKSDRLCNSAVCLPTFVREEAEQQARRFQGTPGANANANANININAIFTPAKNSKRTSRIRCYSEKHGGGSVPTTNVISNATAAIVSSDAGAIKNENNNVATNVNHVAVDIKRGGEDPMKDYLVHRPNPGFDFSHRNSLTYRGAVLNLKRYRTGASGGGHAHHRSLRPASSCPDIISVATTDDKSIPEWKAALQDIKAWMKAIFAWDHLSNTRFVLFILSNFLLYMWYDIPLTFLADTATDLGYSESEGAALGSAIGLLTVLGNIILGYIGDKKWANSVLVYGVCISICGISTALMPCLFGTYFSKDINYYFLTVLCGVFGMMIAANYSLTPVILLQVVSLEKFANAYGLLLLVQGIGNLIGPPIAGLLYDLTGNWSWAFWVAGFGIFISNFFILAPIYKKHQDRWDESRNSSWKNLEKSLEANN